MLVKAILCAVSIALLGNVAEGHGQDAQPVAHVLDVKGEWRLEGSSGAVRPGQGLAAGTRVSLASPRSGDGITILRDEDMSRQRVDCGKDPCQQPIVIAGPHSTQPSGLAQLKSMMQATFSILVSKPPEIGSHYAMTLSRGANSVREWEGVALQDSVHGVELPQPPQDMPAGSYTFSVARAGESSLAADIAVTLTSEGRWRPVPIDAPGLYEVTITNGDQEKVADLMLKVTSAPAFSEERDKFEALQKVVASWTGPDAESDGHLLLRAFMVAGTRP